MRTSLVSGMTGSQFLAGLNANFLDNYSYPFFNILFYGAVGDDNTDNTTAIQAAINAATVKGGIVYIPSGVYKTHKLTKYWNVRIIGDGYTSQLKSIAAEPLVESIYTAVYNADDAGMHNIYLNGDSIGTIGFNTQRLNGFDCWGLSIRGFTSYAMALNGTLIGQFSNCMFNSNGNGIYAAVGNGVSSNLVAFNNCRINWNAGLGFNWSTSLILKLSHCDIESNGALGNANTGCIYYKSGAGVNNKSNVGLIIDGTWFEANNGTLIKIDEPTISQKLISTIRNSMFIVNTSEVAINIIGASTQNKLILSGCGIQDNAGLIINGANASVINQNSGIDGTITKTNNGKYYTSDISET
jgi:hypothetical protein